jgi:hypothetical protein
MPQITDTYVLLLNKRRYLSVQKSCKILHVFCKFNGLVTLLFFVTPQKVPNKTASQIRNLQTTVLTVHITLKNCLGV